MSASAVRLGLVGAGTLSGRVARHLSLDDVADQVNVVAACDPVIDRATWVLEAFPGARASTSLDELLADGRVDAVSIASPIGLHHEQGMAAIAAGKHVHFNKTMAITSAEATELIDAARAAGVRLVASPGEMLRPHNKRIRELLADGAIGRVCWAACGAALGTYHEDEPERGATGDGPDPSWYFRRPGGGPLYDMTVYALHALTGILGSVQRVTAMSGVRVPSRTFGGRQIETDADDNTLMLLDFGESLFAVAYGTAAGVLTEGTTWDPDARYYGTGGEIVAKQVNGAPFDYPGAELARSSPTGDQWLLPHVGPAHRELLEQHVFADIMQLVDAVRDDTPPVATPEHARHVIEIIEAAYEAAASGTTRSLLTTVDGRR